MFEATNQLYKYSSQCSYVMEIKISLKYHVIIGK